jgi:hypothetical protein
MILIYNKIVRDGMECIYRAKKERRRCLMKTLGNSKWKNSRNIVEIYWHRNQLSRDNSKYRSQKNTAHP